MQPLNSQLPGTLFEGEVYCWRSPAAQLCVHPAGSRRGFDLVCPNPALLRFARGLAARDPAVEGMVNNMSWRLRLDCPLPSLALLLGWRHPDPPVSGPSPADAVVTVDSACIEPSDDDGGARDGLISRRGTGDDRDPECDAPPVDHAAPAAVPVQPLVPPASCPPAAVQQRANASSAVRDARARSSQSQGTSRAALKRAERAVADKLKARFRSLLRRFAEKEAGEADLFDASQSTAGEESPPANLRRARASRPRDAEKARTASTIGHAGPGGRPVAREMTAASQQLAWLLALRPRGPLVRRRRKRAMQAAPLLRRVST